MTPEQQQIFSLMATAEQQQKDLEQTITKMNQILGKLPEHLVQQTHETVNQAMQSGLNTGVQQLNKSANQLNQIAQRISKSNELFSWKFIGIGLGLFFALVMGFMFFLLTYVPSLDEIQQRKVDQKTFNQANVQISKTDGKNLVRIKTKKPCYADHGSKVFDWCEIDPKKY